MRRDPTEFRKRFALYKLGKSPYKNGRPLTDEEYVTIMERVAAENNPIWNKLRKEQNIRELSEDEELLRILNDNAYDYRGYYNKYPQSAANADSHWSDEFKTVYHPTFSNLSIYAPNNIHYVGKTLFNPQEIKGGSWDESKKETFIPSLDLKLRIPKFDNGTEPEYRAPMLPEIVIRPNTVKNRIGYDYSYLEPNTNVEKQIFTNPSKWLKYWGRKGADYINQGRESSILTEPMLAASFEIPGLLGWIGGKFVDTATDTIRNKQGGWAGFLSDTFNVTNPYVQQLLGFTNPGYLLGAGFLKPTYNSNIAETNLILAGRYGKKVMTDAVARELNNASKQFDGHTVHSSYFNAPDRWYRITELPEIETIKELGKNVTTTDTGKHPSRTSAWRKKIMLWQPEELRNSPHNVIFGDEPKLLLDNGYLKLVKEPAIFTKLGSAHGNRSLASALTVWKGSVATSHMGFLNGILEGRAPNIIDASFGNRSKFTSIPWGQTYKGQRIGFKTGEMPIDDLGWFTLNKNNSYTYQGQVLPNKEISPIEYFPENRAYFNAIRSGNMDLVQQLRDRHFALNTPNNVLLNEKGLPNKLYHGTDAKFTIPNTTNNLKGVGSTFGPGFYTAPTKNLAKEGTNIMELFGYMKNPNKIWTLQEWFKQNGDYSFGDGVMARKTNRYPLPDTYTDIVFRNPNQLKLADPVTYFKIDDPEVLSGKFKTGDIIPLSMRDNFNRNDIRFSWIIPTLFGTGYPLLNLNNATIKRTK